MDLDTTSLDEVKSESIAQLSEEECRKALSIAVKTIADAIKMNEIRSSQANAFIKLNELRREQKGQWDKKASELAREVDRLHVEGEARDAEIKKMTSSMKRCSKRLNTLVSSSQTAAKGAGFFQAAI